jgi:hypothetical protein
VAAVSPVQASQDGAILVTTVVPSSRPQDQAAGMLLSTLRGTTLPDALRRTGARGYVTGLTAEQLDFRNQVGGQLPVVIGVVLAAAFLLLLATFRSPLLALKAAAANLLSIGASYGVLVAVFQWGWGSSALGISQKIPVESYVPMMMFAIVFGLSMDYEVFLLSRIRESWTVTLDNHASVASGLAATARVITCAALIMASVFLPFLLSTNVVVKMLALGLGVSVLIDATMIRLVVVPATMFLLGRYNWWMPRWLDRALPHLNPRARPPGLNPDPITARPRSRHPDPAAVALRPAAGEVRASSLRSGETAAWRDPGLGLAGDSGNVLEVGVVVQDGRAVVLCDGCGQEVENSCCPVMPTSGHPDLDIPGPLGNRLGDGQHDVQTLAPLGDDTEVSQVTTGIASLQVDRHAGGGRTVHDEPSYDCAHTGVPDPGLRRGVDQVELAWAGRQCHRRACRMTSASAMSGPTPRAYGSSSS